MFADPVFNRTEESIGEIFKVLEMYEKATGARINYEKTLGVYLGCWKNKPPKYKTKVVK